VIFEVKLFYENFRLMVFEHRELTWTPVHIFKIVVHSDDGEEAKKAKMAKMAKKPGILPFLPFCLFASLRIPMQEVDSVNMS